MNIEETMSDNEEDVQEQGAGSTGTSAEVTNETNQDIGSETEGVGNSQNNDQGVTIERKGLKRKLEASSSTIDERPKIARMGFPFVIDETILRQGVYMHSQAGYTREHRHRRVVVRPLSATWQRIVKTHEVNPPNSPPGNNPPTTAPTPRNPHPVEDDDDEEDDAEDDDVDAEDDAEEDEDQNEGSGEEDEEGEEAEQEQEQDVEVEFNFDFEEFGDGAAHNPNVEENVNENGDGNGDALNDIVPAINNLLINLLANLPNQGPLPNAGPAGAGVNAPNPQGNPRAPPLGVIRHNLQMSLNNLQEARGALRQIRRNLRRTLRRRNLRRGGQPR